MRSMHEANHPAKGNGISATASRRSFSVYAIWYGVGLVFCVLFSGYIARSFQAHTQAPAFTALEDLIGQPLGRVIPAEIIEETEHRIGAAPVADAKTGDVAMVRAAFRTGNLDPKSVQFLEWGQAVPYAFEGGFYWAVPFRYEADMGFGSARRDTATALIRNGTVTRFLYVPYWNFANGQGTR